MLIYLPTCTYAELLFYQNNHHQRKQTTYTILSSTSCSDLGVRKIASTKTNMQSISEIIHLDSLFVYQKQYR